MYCKNCNRKGKKDEKYCSECGSKLTKQKSTFKLSQKSKNTIGILAGLLIMIFAAYGIACYIFSPEEAARKYFDAVINNDEETIYSYIDVESSDFISKKLLSEKMVKFAKIESYEIVDTEEYGNEVIVTFRYKLKDTNEIRKVLVSLTREDGIFFDKWKVNSGKLTKNVTIKVPNNAIVTIDNMDITKYEIDDDSEYYQTYRIPAIITGEYQVKTILNDVTVVDNVTFQTDGTYYIGNFDLDEKTSSVIEENTISSLNYIYASAIQNKSFSELTNVDSNLEKDYKALKRTLNMDNINVTEIKFTDAEVKNATYDEFGNLEVTLIGDYDMSYQVSSTKETNTSKFSDYMVLTFKYENGNYILYEIDDLLNWKVRW